MERNRGTVIAVIAALVVSVISLGVAFAAFSTTLTINGNATITSSAWDIHYSTTQRDSQNPSTTGLAPNPSATITPQSGSTATNVTSTLEPQKFTWNATFKTPGDYIEYRFYIVNAGDYNATITGTFTQTPECTLEGQSTAMETCPITYTVTKDGSTAFSGSDSLAKGASQLVVVKAQLDPNYGGSGSGLNSSNINVTVGDIVFTYTQSGSAQ